MGFAIYFPSPDDMCAKRAADIAAGPTASLLLAMVIAISIKAMELRQQNPPWQETALFLISTFLFVASTIPCTSKYMKGLDSRTPPKNDGAVLVKLWRKRKVWAAYYTQCEEYRARGTTYEAELARYHAEQEAYQAELATYDAELAHYEAINALHARAEAGERPCDWDAVLVERATSLKDRKANEATAAYNAFYWGKDWNDPEASGRYISRALKLRGLFTDAYQANALLDGAYYAGFRQGDAIAARRLLADAVAFPTPDDADEFALLRSITLRAEAATLLAEGKAREARLTAEEGSAVLADVKESSVRADQCLMERLIAVCASLSDAQPFPCAAADVDTVMQDRTRFR